MSARRTPSTPDGSPESDLVGGGLHSAEFSTTSARHLVEKWYGDSRLDDAELTVYVLPWGSSNHTVQVAVFSIRLVDGGEEFEIEIASFAMPSQLGLRTLFVNPTILGVLRTSGKEFELPNDLADCIFVGLHQLRAGRDLSTPLAESGSASAEPTELARQAAARFSAQFILRSELLAIPASRWRIGARESNGEASQFETQLQLINEDPYEAKILLSKSFGGLEGTPGDRIDGDRSPKFALTVSNHAEAERAAGGVTSSDAQEWYESIMVAINDNRRRYQRGARLKL